MEFARMHNEYNAEAPTATATFARAPGALPVVGHLLSILRDPLYAITGGTLATALFGVNLDEAEIAELERSINTILTGAFQQQLLPGPLRKLPTRANRRYARANAHLNAAVHRIIDGYRSGTLGHQSSMLSLLLAARDEDGVGALSDAEIYDQVKAFLMAGVDTTAWALSWACHLLAAHPDIQEQLHAEVSAVLGGRVARWADLPKLNLTGRVIKETLRMYPPAWVMTRTVTRDTELAGQHLPSGSTLVYSPYLLHRRADLFPEPELFRPDRWLAVGSRRPRGGFVPFGAGARQCIGNDFGLIEATLALATIADRWCLTETADRVFPRPVPRMILSLTPTPLRLHRRRTSA